MPQSLITGVTNYWCRTQGIRSRDLTEHPQIDDVIILIKFIQEYQRDFTDKQRMTVWLIWDWCYKQRHSLMRKHLKALEKIIYRIHQVRNLRHQAHLKAKKRIKALKNPS